MLSFYLSYLIYRWPIYRVIFFLHESIIRRYWPTWISIVFIGFTGSRMCSVLMPLFHQVYYHLLKIVNSKCLLSVNGMSMINNYLVNNKKLVWKRVCISIFSKYIYLICNNSIYAKLDLTQLTYLRVLIMLKIARHSYVRWCVLNHPFAFLFAYLHLQNGSGCYYSVHCKVVKWNTIQER